MSDIKGLETWEDETRTWNKNAGRLKVRAGIGMVDALEHWYKEWQTKHTPRNKREYLQWRLRLHLKHNADPEFLEELNETFELGLHDDTVGKLLWDIEPEHKFAFTSGFNWRRDSGEAIRGRSRRTERDAEDMGEFDD